MFSEAVFGLKASESNLSLTSLTSPGQGVGQPPVCRRRALVQQMEYAYHGSWRYQSGHL